MKLFGSQIYRHSQKIIELCLDCYEILFITSLAINVPTGCQFQRLCLFIAKPFALGSLVPRNDNKCGKLQAGANLTGRSPLAMTINFSKKIPPKRRYFQCFHLFEIKLNFFNQFKQQFFEVFLNSVCCFRYFCV